MKKTLVKLGVTIAVLLFTIFHFDIDFDLVFNSIQNVYFIFIAVFIPVLINPLIGNNRWKFFLKVQGVNEKIGTLIKYNFVSLFMGLALPATTGSDALRIYFIEKKHNDYKGRGGASVIIERLIGFLLLAILGLVGSIIVSIKTGSDKTIYILSIIIVFILFVFVSLKNRWLFTKISNFLIKVKRFKKVSNYLHSLYQSLNLFPIKKSLKYTIPLILAFQFSTIVCGYLVFLAFAVDLPFYNHLAILPLIQIISIIPVSISGFGIREGSFVYFYRILGVNENIAR